MKASEVCEQIKKEFWGQNRNQLYGVGYDKEADILTDINHLIRHFLYKERGDTDKAIVDAYPAFRWCEEPLIEITKIEYKDGK